MPYDVLDMPYDAWLACQDFTTLHAVIDAKKMITIVLNKKCTYILHTAAFSMTCNNGLLSRKYAGMFFLFRTQREEIHGEQNMATQPSACFRHVRGIYMLSNALTPPFPPRA
jgi:hypothetical protein